jgi:hypothetical protein
MLRSDDGGYVAASARPNALSFVDGRNLAWWYAKAVRWLPPARRRFDPADFRYLSLFDWHIDPGAERLAPLLVDELLRRYDRHTANLLTPADSAVRRALELAGLFGAFSRRTETRIDVMATPLSGSIPDVERIGLIPLDV